MIDKQYCYKLLYEQKSMGCDCDNLIKELALSVNVPKNVIQFLNDKRKIDVTLFFESLRERNKRRTNKLYSTLLKEEDNIPELSKALSSYITQCFIFTEAMDEVKKHEILEQLRVKEVVNALNSYLTNKDIKPILNVCKSISSDIKMLECR